jgi:hypothetical protein
MIVRKVFGKGAIGLLRYLMRQHTADGAEKRPVRIGGNLAGQSPREMAHEMGALRRLRPKLGKAVAHFSLSLNPEDRPVSDIEMSSMADDFLKEMGFVDVPYVVVRHADSHFQHFHIAALRISYRDSTVISDKNDFRKAEVAARKLETKYGLIPLDLSKPKPHQPPNPKEEPKGDEDMNIDDIIPPRERKRPPVDTETYSIAYGDGDDLTDHHQRELRRQVFDPLWEQTIRQTFYADFKSVRKHQWGLELQFRGGGVIKDFGHKIVAERLPDEIAGEKVVEMARQRGWQKMIFTGSPAFVRAAMAASMNAGIEPIARDSMQIQILAELITSGNGSGAPVRPAPTPDATPPTPDLRSSTATRPMPGSR